MITASSAAREGASGEGGDRQRADGGGAERKAAELAAGHGVSSGVGGLEGSLERGPRFAIGWRLARCPKIRGQSGICYSAGHTSS